MPKKRGEKGTHRCNNAVNAGRRGEVPALDLRREKKKEGRPLHRELLGRKKERGSTKVLRGKKKEKEKKKRKGGEFPTPAYAKRREIPSPNRSVRERKVPVEEKEDFSKKRGGERERTNGRREPQKKKKGKRKKKKKTTREL